MTGKKWTVGGVVFYSMSDYQAGLRDQEKIRSLKTGVDFRDPESVIRLYKRMAAEQYQFETELGRKFDDTVYELAEKYKKQFPEKAAEKSAKKGRRPRRKAAGAGNARGRGKPADGRGLEDYDEKMRQEILQQLKKQEKRRKLIVILCGAAAAVCLGYFFTYNYFTVRTENQAENLAQLKGDLTLAGGTAGINLDDRDKPDVLDEYKTLYNKNKSLIGWLKIDDTVIDYPVMQSQNTEYYLTHNFNQEYDRNGSIFLDPACDVLKPGTNLIVYGHHMKSGKMFGGLNKYSNREYYEKHRKIQFDSIYEKGVYEVMFVFRSKIFYEDEITFKYYQFTQANSEAEFNSAMEAMSELSLYDTGVTAAYGDSLLTLSTCDNSEEDGRFVVVAKRIS